MSAHREDQTERRDRALQSKINCDVYHNLKTNHQVKNVTVITLLSIFGRFFSHCAFFTRHKCDLYHYK
jgi:hypothetical protein